MIIIKEEYQKNNYLRANEGYSLRNKNIEYKTLVIHTTNGRANSSIGAERNFLIMSKDVSAHYLVSKTGDTFQLLNPAEYVAWHTGKTFTPDTANPSAIGVEVHFSPLEGFWNGLMWEEITRLARTYPGLNPQMHRSIAAPAGRKIDPSGVTDAGFAHWKKMRLTPYKIYTTTTRANIRKSVTRDSAVVTTLEAGTPVMSFDADIFFGETINGVSRWRYAVGLGYIFEPLLKARS
jgi:N-acetyl-anhydromuramyl-L-alanine amidase AmpD